MGHILQGKWSVEIKDKGTRAIDYRWRERFFEEGDRMYPLIGITMSYSADESYTLKNGYVDAVLNAGGLPVLLPYVLDEKKMNELASRLDGLLLSGGGDVDPYYFGEEPNLKLGEVVPERDQMEMRLAQKVIERQKPVLGVCRGCQVLNVALGGSLYQDLPTQKDRVLQHSQRAPRSHASHGIVIHSDSLLCSIVKKTEIRVNSYHHQAIRQVAPSLSPVAFSSDGVVEAMERVGGSFLLGVQWHPECMLDSCDEAQLIFNAFVEQCGVLQGEVGRK